MFAFIFSMMSEASTSRVRALSLSELVSLKLKIILIPLSGSHPIVINIKKKNSKEAIIHYGQ